jgi:hypothetical protein
MSTKIYDAFRIKKEIDIKDVITEMRSIASDVVSNSVDYLYLIHAFAAKTATEKKDTDKMAMEAYNDAINNDFGICLEMWMLSMVKTAETSSKKDIFDCSLKAVCSFDEDYWYIKFFSNSGISRKMLNAIIKKLGVLEDFHYQNQTDPPEDIPEEEYNKRGDKWNQLLPNWSPFNVFPFDVTIFDSNKLEKLIFDFKYKQKELAYKFDKKYEKIIQK